MPAPIARTALSIACLLLASGSASAGPLDWAKQKLGFGGEDKPKPGVVPAQSGAITLLLDQPTRLPVDDSAPSAELPKGRSYFRRVELVKPVDEARIDIRVIAQDSAKTKSRTVFKPLFYVLDDEGNVRETVSADALKIDIRPFQPTALVGCIRVKQLQRFLVATTEKDVGQAYESGARDSVKAASKGGFYYSTDAVKVKLPYAATGEMVLTVSQSGKDKDCVDAATADAKDAKDEDGKGKQAAG